MFQASQPMRARTCVAVCGSIMTTRARMKDTPTLMASARCISGAHAGRAQQQQGAPRIVAAQHRLHRLHGQVTVGAVLVEGQVLVLPARQAAPRGQEQRSAVHKNAARGSGGGEQ